MSPKLSWKRRQLIDIRWRPNHFVAAVTASSSRRPLAASLLALLSLTLLAGCGESSTNQPTVVTPPDPSNPQTTPAETSDDPPGELVMPPGEVPPTEPAEESEPAEKEGGLEMPKQSANETSSASTDIAATDAAVPPIRFATWNEIEQHVSSTGQVTVVDLWSLACEPCLKEFPGLVRLHQSYGDSVTCVAVDLDYDGRKTRPPEYYQPRVTDFLQSVGADFTTFISSTPNDEIFAATNIDSIPAVLIYDSKGEIVKVFADTGETQGFSYDEDIIPLVAKMAG